MLGGLIDDDNGGEVIDSHASGDVSGEGYSMAGLFGERHGTFTDFHTSGDLS